MKRKVFLTILTFQVELRQSAYFVLDFSCLKPNQRFGGIQLPNLTPKCSRTPIALYYRVVRSYYFFLCSSSGILTIPAPATRHFSPSSFNLITTLKSDQLMPLTVT